MFDTTRPICVSVINKAGNFYLEETLFLGEFIVDLGKFNLKTLTGEDVTLSNLL